MATLFENFKTKKQAYEGENTGYKLGEAAAREAGLLKKKKTTELIGNVIRELSFKDGEQEIELAMYQAFEELVGELKIEPEDIKG